MIIYSGLQRTLHLFSVFPILIAVMVVGCDGGDSAPELTATEVEIERWEIETPTSNLVSGRPILRLGDTFTLSWDVVANGVAEIKLLFTDGEFEEFGEAADHEQVFFVKRCPTANSCELVMSIDCVYTQQREIMCPDSRGTTLQVFSDDGDSIVALQLRARGRQSLRLNGFTVEFE